MSFSVWCQDTSFISFSSLLADSCNSPLLYICIPQSSSSLHICSYKTVADKEGKIRGAGLEKNIIINDWRAKTLERMETALMFWETCCLLSLACSQHMGQNKQNHRKKAKFPSSVVFPFMFTDWTRITLYCTFMR